LKSCGLPELWILEKFSVAAEAANRNFATFNLMNVSGAAHQFWLYEVCDVFIEAVKPILPGSQSAADVLYFVLEQGLQMLHPMMPFLTEELWQRLPRRPQSTTPSICLAAYPQPLPASEIITAGAAKFEEIVGVVRVVRSAATDRKLAPKTSIIHVAASDPLFSILKQNEVTVQALTKAAVGRVEVIASEAGEGEELQGFKQ
jgi:valyl-tRNA synthetase